MCSHVLWAREGLPPTAGLTAPVVGTNYMLQREMWDLHDFSYPNEKNGNTYIGGGRQGGGSRSAGLRGGGGLGGWI